jgi:hypothetical protein
MSKKKTKKADVPTCCAATPEDKQRWETEEDVRSLMNVAKIRSDPARSKRAGAELKSQENMISRAIDENRSGRKKGR